MSHSKLAWALAFLIPMPALAHTGALGLSSFNAGFLHPFLGLDHAMMLVAAAAWLAQSKSIKTALVCLAGLLLALMVGIGAAPYLAGLNWEPGIALSLVAVGVLVVKQSRIASKAILGLLIAAGFVHGVVHGIEMPAQGSSVFATGLILGSTTIALATWVSVKALGRQFGNSSWLRYIGFGAALLGLSAGL